jgi:hypothetical protein
MKKHSESGQASIEMALMLVVIVAMALAVSQGFKSNQIFANLISGPWRSLSGLIQNGVWGDPASTVAKHPNGFSRISSPEGEVAQ